MSSATPTTVTQGVVSERMRKHLPTASSRGQSVLAMLSLITATSGAPNRSGSVNARPRTTRVRIVAKYPGVVAWYVKTPSRFAESIPGTKSVDDEVLTNGALLTHAADSTPGSDCAVARRSFR